MKGGGYMLFQIAVIHDVKTEGAFSFSIPAGTVMDVYGTVEYKFIAYNPKIAETFVQIPYFDCRPASTSPAGD